MTLTTQGRALAAAVLASLAVPGAAAAAPAVFTTTAKIVPAGQTPDPSWTQADLEDQTRYVVSVNGFTVGLTETNAALSGGVVSFEVLPSAYRSLFPAARLIAEGQTGAQPHATCDVASLTDPAVVSGWQGAEPAYGYIPFQATTAGLGDDPATWLTKVKDATGVTLTSATNLASACTGLGGTFVAADAVSVPAATLAAGLLSPLQTQIGTLQTKVNELTTARAAALDGKAKAEAEVKRLTLEAAPFTVKVPSSATLQRGLEVNVTGPPSRRVFVRVQVTETQRKALGLRLRTLGVGEGATDAKGKAKVIVAPRKGTARVLLTQVTAVPVLVVAASGDRGVTLPLDLGA